MIKLTPRYVNDFPGYLIYPDGKIYSTVNKKFLKPARMGRNGGYLTVTIKNQYDFLCRAKIHRLVAQAFIPNPQGYPIVNHIDGNKLNNTVENLEWCSYSQNNQHAYDIGLKKGKRRITDLKDIFEDYVSQKYSRKDLEEKYSWFTSRGFNGYLGEYAKQVGRYQEFLDAKNSLKRRACAKASLTRNKRILQVSLDGEPVKTWNSIKDASTTLQLNAGYLGKCCKVNKPYGNFYWKFIENN